MQSFCIFGGRGEQQVRRVPHHFSVVYWRWHHRIVVPSELDENWLGYGNLELGKVMDEVVGKYGEEVGYWKNRTGRVE
ncbi:hypothetical protein [Hyphococcus luteus]|uniref:Uncharacterized protein n=1 Tax=Hyphococcus luteus TaxID=2058213 RepID=A0A2S7K9T9_9PROT|nr:hypothetical protein [Marinicaulis flavus]PQA89253.1 hypothetical protein CW354_04775 [Marinicaulis flavus]